MMTHRSSVIFIFFWRKYLNPKSAAEEMCEVGRENMVNLEQNQIVSGDSVKDILTLKTNFGFQMRFSHCARRIIICQHP